MISKYGTARVLGVCVLSVLDLTGMVPRLFVKRIRDSMFGILGWLRVQVTLAPYTIHPPARS